MSFRLFQWTTRCSVGRWKAVLGFVVFSIVAIWGGQRGYVAWQVRVARTALADGRAGQALAALRKAQMCGSGDAQVLFLLGRALRRSDELADVHAYLDRAVLAGWPEDEVRQQRYLMLMQTGNFDQSDGYLAEVLRSGANDDLAEEIYEARAKGFFAIYDLNEALRCLHFWLKWRPQARQALMWRAEIWKRCARWHDAIPEYRTILNRDPHDFEARLMLADALLFERDAPGALGEYQKCVAARPDDAAALFGVLKCQQRLGVPSDAKSGLLALLERDLSPAQKGEVLLELGELALFNQNYQQAVEMLERAREVDAANQFIYAPLSRAYARTGKTELADEAKRRGLETTKRLARLLELTKKMIDVPRDPELRYEAGMLFFAEGAGKEGAAWLHTALKCDPGHRKSHAALADYYERIGDAALTSHHRKMAEDVGQRDSALRSKLGSS